MGPAKDAEGGERREVRRETATPRRVSARCWNLSIYCNTSGMPDHPCHIARLDIGRGRDTLPRDPALHVQKTCNGKLTCPSELVSLRVGPCHIARPDIGRGRGTLLRDPAWNVQKRATAIFDL